MTKKIVRPVILCGGSGTRLWPLSRSGFPKQFLCLTGNESLFQQAAKRLQKLSADGVLVLSPYIVCNEEHRFLAQEQLREVGFESATFILEPVGRNTAPALTIAALSAFQSDSDPILVVTPADQNISIQDSYLGSLEKAVDIAASGNIAILGISPDRPETGYGYIKASGLGKVREVECFVEKPDKKTAEQYFVDGGYFWNAGIFVLRSSVWISALQKFRPDIGDACNKAWEGKQIDGDFVRPDSNLFAEIPSDSIDYAVIEKCPGSDFAVNMVELDAGWSDLGAWDAVWNVLPKDTSGNAYQGDVELSDCGNMLIHANSRLVAAVGVENLVIIETPDAVLVTHKSRSQDVKHIVNMLGQKKRDEQSLHRKVHRPWGWYDSIDEGGRFKVKRILVKPKASLSLQKHHHRAEHWIVVKGTAEVTNGSKVILLTENQSTYIPLGETHRLRNPGTIPLEIIEVQSGGYLGEDDIVRFDDVYGRDS